MIECERGILRKFITLSVVSAAPKPLRLIADEICHTLLLLSLPRLDNANGLLNGFE